MTSEILRTVDSPNDIKQLNDDELNLLAEELREYIIDVVSKNGGHLAPNLGVVELTLALHKVFDTPQDKIIWDVGHQSYVHKIITGRREAFKTIRQYQGLSGFPKISESEHDAFGTGHSSTSISAAVGMAVARDMKGEKHNVIAVIGDGSMTGGMAFEALNNAGDLKKKLIIVLNDNEMSISKNVGAMSEYLYQLRTAKTYTRLKKDFESWLETKNYGENVINLIRRVKGSVKYLLVPGSVFEHLGFKYYGPIDGHDIEHMTEVFTLAKEIDGPVIVHVITQKGKGYAPAEAEPNKYHGTGPFNRSETETKISGKTEIPTYTQVFGRTVTDLGKENTELVAITAAMPDGTGLSVFAKEIPDRFFDVGIAEQHAVTAAAGMAASGLHPIVAIYSSFMQRAYDSVLHDVCMQNLPVIFCLDRAGLVGDDGYTHHGVYDFAYFNSMPGMTVMAPKDENELRHMLKTAVEYNGPIAVRYPRGSGVGVDITEELKTLPIGKAEVLSEGKDICLWAAGSMVNVAQNVAEALKAEGVEAGVVNIRFVKPLDEELLLQTAKRYKKIVIIEEGTLQGGVGSSILQALNKHRMLKDVSVLNLGIPDEYVPHGAKALLLRDLGLDYEGILKKVKAFVASDGE